MDDLMTSLARGRFLHAKVATAILFFRLSVRDTGASVKNGAS